MGDIDTALKVIATAADALVILGLMRAQIKERDNSNAMGYLLSYAIFAMNIMVIWK
jgi:hypothetical protein